jgi:ribosome-binding factor A
MRLQETIKARVAHVVAYEMADPRRGLITITRVELDREMVQCKVYWSILGDEAVRRRNAIMLDHARKFVQHEVAEVLHTRTVPRVQFVYDESIEGVARVEAILQRLRKEREERESAAEQPLSDPEQQPPPAEDGPRPT